MSDLWKSIRKRFASRQTRALEAAPDLFPADAPFQDIISLCLPLLHSYGAGAMLYFLDCLYPKNFSVLQFADLDLSLTHQHRRCPVTEARLDASSCEGLLSRLRAIAGPIPAVDYPRFWLELTRACLLTSPVDPKYYLEDESGRELFCRRLLGELVERILRID